MAVAQSSTLRGEGLAAVGLIVEVLMSESTLLGPEGYGAMGKRSKWFCGSNTSKGQENLTNGRTIFAGGLWVGGVLAIASLMIGT